MGQHPAIERLNLQVQPNQTRGTNSDSYRQFVEIRRKKCYGTGQGGCTFGKSTFILTTDRVILGMDPGTTIMGYGLIHIEKKQMRLLSCGVIHLQKLDEHADKLKRIFERTLGLIDEYKPDEFAVEAPF